MRHLVAIFTAIFLSISAHADNILIENVTVITMDGGKVLKNATVAINNDKITMLAGSDELSWLDQWRTDETHNNDPIVIDGTGKFLFPGLAEMHGHLPFNSASSQDTKDTLFLYLAGGVTTVRGMLGDPEQFEMRAAITAGEIAGPTLYLAAPSLNGNTVTSPADGVAKVKSYHVAGYDLLKIHPGLTRAEYDAIAKIANSLGMPFGGHVPADVGLERALEAGQISLDHMDGYIIWMDGDKRIWTAQELKRAVDITKASGTWIVPTQALFNTFYSGDSSHDLLSKPVIASLLARPENAYVPKSQLARWKRIAQAATPNPIAVQNRQSLLKVFADANVNIAMGSDAPQTFSVPGFSIWREIEVMVEAGLTPDQILSIGTKAAGSHFQDKAKFGTISIGSRADLLLLSADPRLDAKNLFKQTGVIAAGRWYSRETIDKNLAAIANRHQ